MADTVSFWKGVSFGLLTGLASVAVLKMAGFESYFNDLPSPKEGQNSHIFAAERFGVGGLGSLPPAFRSRRDHPESAGDPGGLASARTGATARFTRRGGAPGGQNEVEVMEYPGRSGQRIDASAPVRAASRTLKLN